MDESTTKSRILILSEIERETFKYLNAKFIFQFYFTGIIRYNDRFEIFQVEGSPVIFHG